MPTKDSVENMIKNLQYRADVDGLRAIAVLSVVLNHYFAELIPGGYVGVDIFFVISGFLITGNMLKENQLGRISIMDFYARRAKRILPSLIVVLITVLLAGWALLFSSEYGTLGKHLFNASFFFANFGYYFDVGYFAPEAGLKPLLHLWSLGVEEQFYLAWPLLLIASLKKNFRFANGMTLLFLIGSLAWNIHSTHHGSSKSFYLPQYRAWELLAGALIAFAQMRSKKVLAYRNEISFLGAAILFSSFAMLNSNSLFPGALAILPVLGATLLLAAGQDAAFNRTFLSKRILVWFGLISYPLYLWHWPALAFLRYCQPFGISINAKIVSIALSILFAWASYRWVELPIRHSRPKIKSTLKSSMKLPLFLFCTNLSLGCIGLLLYKFQPTTRLNKIDRIIEDANRDWTFPENLNWKEKSNFKTKEVGKINAHAILLIGDSHIEQYWSRAQYLSEIDGNNRFVFATYPGCPPLPEIDLQSEELFACDAFTRYAFDLAQKPEFDTIVLGGYWERIFGLGVSNENAPKAYWIKSPNHSPLKLGSADFKSALDAFGKKIALLTKQGKKVFVFLSNPASPALKPANLYSRFTALPLANPVIKESLAEKPKPLMELIAKIALESGAIIVDPMDFLCSENECKSVSVSGEPIYKDDNHLRSSFIREHATYFDSVVKK